MVSSINGEIQAKALSKQDTKGAYLGPKRDENREWGRFHNEKHHSLYRSPNLIRVIKSGRLS